jgi:hypothetical protein
LRPQRAEELLVLTRGSKIAAVAQEQHLVEGALEPVMPLLDIAVLVRPARLDFLAGHFVMP